MSCAPPGLHTSSLLQPEPGLTKPASSRSHLACQAPRSQDSILGPPKVGRPRPSGSGDCLTQGRQAGQSAHCTPSLHKICKNEPHSPGVGRKAGGSMSFLQFPEPKTTSHCCRFTQGDSGVSFLDFPGLTPGKLLLCSFPRPHVPFREGGGGLGLKISCSPSGAHASSLALSPAGPGQP